MMTDDSRPHVGAAGYRYIIGIDLGTTNSAVAYVDLTGAQGDHALPPVQFFEIPQLVAPAEVAGRSMLPSFLYLPGEYDLSPGDASLPWDRDRAYIVGEFAREQGVRVPGRLVASAKSWLSHDGVDRTAPILPWGAPSDVAKVSPVTAAARYLIHLREAWNAEMAGELVEDLFERQLIILTVPASFDEVARELTVQAAAQAGIPQAILLEEPLAAFYAWLARHENEWESTLTDGQLVLVCDIGGGTTDFTLVGVRTVDGRLQLDRLAVGEHLLLGGDNMDLTLGRHLERTLLGAPGKLDPARWTQLVDQCRRAKEELLAGTDEEVDISVVGGGSGLIGGTLRSTLTRHDVADLILGGFFPQTALDAELDRRPRSGLAELGLPYVQDPAITRHLAAFWRNFVPLLVEETGRPQPVPDFVLFNGGALTPESLRRRLVEIVGGWFAGAVAAPGWQPAELSNPRPELAVAIGAAYYGLVRMGAGVRIGSGTPRAYFIAVREETPAAAPVDEEERIPAVCLVPRGVQEGFDTRLRDPVFQALTNRPVTFDVYSSTTRLGDRVGDLVQLAPEEISILPRVQTVLRFGRKGVASEIPVQLAVRLTETGTLELYCDSLQTEHRWPLRFDIRQEETPVVGDDGDALAGVTPEQLAATRERIRSTFGATRAAAPEQLRKGMEQDLGLAKEEWPASLIRLLADEFLAVAQDRAPTFQHEAVWLNLLGFCMRPGFGDPADELRMKRVWSLYLEGLRFPQKVQNRTESWIFWRRVAAGFSAGRQLQLYEQIFPSLQSGDERRKKSKTQRYHLGAAEELEVWLMLANFERLPADVKTRLGRLLLRKIGKEQPKRKELWAMSRFGARETAYGPLNQVTPPQAAEEWLAALLVKNLPRTGATAHALLHLAQFTGDRARDISDSARNRVVDWLNGVDGREHYLELLMNPERNRDRDEQDWVFGEALPAGLAIYVSEK